MEIARRARDGKLPAKQEAFIADLQQWCQVKWGTSPKRSTLLQKVKPFYDGMFRKSETSV